MSKLVIGTANFNQPYGRKRLKADGNSILHSAKELGIDTVEVSDDYGNYGETFLWNHFKYIVKISTIEQLEAAVKMPEYVYAIMAHGYEAWQKLGHIMSNVIPPNIKIGVSLYDPKELDATLPSVLQIVEVPVNLVDQRWIPLLPHLRIRRIEVVARSLFLHGTLFESSWKGYPLALYSYNMARANNGIDRIIVGVDDAAQLVEIANYPELEVNYEHLSNNRSKKWLKPVAFQSIPTSGTIEVRSGQGIGTGAEKQADQSRCDSGDNAVTGGQGDNPDSPE